MISKGHYSEAERQRIVSLLHSGCSSAELADRNGIAPETIKAWDEEGKARREMEEMYATAISSKDVFVVRTPYGLKLISWLLFFLKSHWVIIATFCIIALCGMIFFVSFNGVTQRVSMMSQNKTEQKLDSISFAIEHIEVLLNENDRRSAVWSQYSEMMCKTLSALSDDVKLMRKSNVYWNNWHHKCCSCQTADSIINRK